MSEIEIISGDITQLTVDALVCPAHKYLSRGQGLSAQIHDQAGAQLEQECHRLEDCRIGEARLTHADHLPARHIIHTVTPQWSSGDQWGATAIQQLRQCYHSCIQLALDHQLKRIAFPALGAGSNRFPHSIAASVGLDVLNSRCDLFERVVVCLHTEGARRVWLDSLQKIQARSSPVAPPTQAGTANEART
ncbi:phosphatase [Aestuariicella hydrocarbonica]|uniref:Phosphatase n=1 Tax=Pseudomaricurvus hydrocarbonicus TaxID=1470433 RepID=A0A9E5MJX5_9GAMM|nr:macro domain-containing protein [Aestuariicella hydrocarbonica]NHO64597.1 phosphatase [Aestuariicella hydrocarbonica]